MANATVCPGCEEVMRDTTSCLVVELELDDGEIQTRTPYGGESYFVDAPEAPRVALLRRCHDCGVAIGQPHHALCDFEACPDCGTQMLACACERGDEDLGHCGDHGEMRLIIHRKTPLLDDEAGLEPDNVDAFTTLCENCHGVEDLAAQLGR